MSDEMFCKARELARSAMNKAQSAMDEGQPTRAQDWGYIAVGWARVADLYREGK